MAEPEGAAKLFVVLSETSRLRQPRDVLSTLALRSLEEPNTLVRFDTFESESAARLVRGNHYRLVFGVTGQWAEPPTHAVYAEWQVGDSEKADEFLESRRQLFELRRQVLPTFALDWLLQHLDQRGRYMVLGLYGDEEGATRLCREHPEIQRFATSHPLAGYAATDLTGLRCFRIEPRMAV